MRVLKDYGIIFVCRDQRDRRLCVTDILHELHVKMEDTGNYLCMRTTPVRIHPGFPTGGRQPIIWPNEENWTGGYVRNVYVSICPLTKDGFVKVVV